MAQQPSAGWYPQPDGTQRYWDGNQWTQYVAPGPQATPTVPMRTPATQPTYGSQPTYSSQPTYGSQPTYSSQATREARPPKKPIYQQLWFWMLIALLGFPLAVSTLFPGNTSSVRPSSGLPAEVPLVVPTATETPTLEVTIEATPTPSVDKKVSATPTPDKPTKKPKETPTVDKPTKEPKKTPTAEATKKVAKIGDTTRVGDLAVKVVSAERKTKLSGVFGSKKGNWMLVTVKVTNKGKRQTTVYNSDFQLLESDGTKYSHYGDGWKYIDSDYSFSKELNPKTSATGKLLFEIPKSAKNLTLEVSIGFIFKETGEISLGKK